MKKDMVVKNQNKGNIMKQMHCNDCGKMHPKGMCKKK